MFEIKPLDSDTDLDKVAKRVLNIKKDGVYWKTELLKGPVVLGTCKFIMSGGVGDEKRPSDGLQDEIEPFAHMVQ